MLLDNLCDVTQSIWRPKKAGLRFPWDIKENPPVEKSFCLCLWNFNLFMIFPFWLVALQILGLLSQTPRSDKQMSCDKSLYVHMYCISSVHIHMIYVIERFEIEIICLLSFYLSISYVLLICLSCWTLADTEG